jgi:hypothetical protein
MTATPYDNGPGTAATPDTGFSNLFKTNQYYRYLDWGDDNATADLSGNVCSRANDVLECKTCVETKGYYLFADKTKITNDKTAVFKGDWLNAYPPKYVVARTVLKDIVSINTNLPTNLDGIRFGLTVFNPANGGAIGGSLGANDGAKLVVELGPDCNTAFPVDALKYIPWRKKLVAALNDKLQVSFSGSSPLGAVHLRRFQ